MVLVRCILWIIENNLLIKKVMEMVLTRNMGINRSSFFVKSSGRCPCFAGCIKVLLSTKFLARKLPYG
jgi:hypothetical protein